MTDTLFRKQAVQFRNGPQAASHTGAPRISHWLIAFFSIFVIVALASILWFGTYAASDAVRGYVSTTDSSLQVFSPRSGVITELLVAEGELVEAGAPLLSVSAERLGNGGSVDDALIAALQTELATVAGRFARADTLSSRQAEALIRRIGSADVQLALLQTQLRLSNESLELSASSIARAQLLQSRGHLANSELQRQRAEHLRRQQEHVALERDLSDLRASLDSMRSDLAAQPLIHADTLAKLQAMRLQLQRDLATARSTAAFTITASAAGVVSGLTVAAGQAVTGRMPLLTLLPEDPQFHVLLLLPSRTAGFVQPGDPVSLRIDAFPYQAFGTLAGIVRAKSSSVLMPGEFSAPVRFSEPGYRVEVEFDPGALAARHPAMRLQPGMTVVADIKRERRRLIAWLMEPLIGAVRRL